MLFSKTSILVEFLRDFLHISTFFVDLKVILQTSSAAQ